MWGEIAQWLRTETVTPEALRSQAQYPTPLSARGEQGSDNKTNQPTNQPKPSQTRQSCGDIWAVRPDSAGPKERINIPTTTDVSRPPDGQLAGKVGDPGSRLPPTALEEVLVTRFCFYLKTQRTPQKTRR